MKRFVLATALATAALLAGCGSVTIHTGGGGVLPGPVASPAPDGRPGGAADPVVVSAPIVGYYYMAGLGQYYYYDGSMWHRWDDAGSWFVDAGFVWRGDYSYYWDYDPYWYAYQYDPYWSPDRDPYYWDEWYYDDDYEWYDPYYYGDEWYDPYYYYDDGYDGYYDYDEWYYDEYW